MCGRKIEIVGYRPEILSDFYKIIDFIGEFMKIHEWRGELLMLVNGDFIRDTASFVYTGRKEGRK